MTHQLRATHARRFCASLIALALAGCSGAPDVGQDEGYETEVAADDSRILPKRVRFQLEDWTAWDDETPTVEVEWSEQRVVKLTAYANEAGQQSFPVMYMQLSADHWQEGSFSCVDDPNALFLAKRDREDRLETMIAAEDGTLTKRPCTVRIEQVVEWQEAVRANPALYANMPGPAQGTRYLVRGHFEADVGPKSGASCCDDSCGGAEPGCDSELTVRGSFDLWDDVYHY